MITEQDLQEAIAECKGERNPNSHTCIKLASYLIIQKELYGTSEESREPYYSFDAGPEIDQGSFIGYISDTEFAQKINGMDQECVMEVMDELMELLRVLYPQIYNSVMRKL